MRCVQIWGGYYLYLPYLDDVVTGGCDVCIVWRPGYAVNGNGGKRGNELAILSIPDMGSGIASSTGGDVFSIM